MDQTEERILYLDYCKTIWQKEGYLSKTYNLEGQRFGHLTVIKKTVNPNTQKKRTFWLCKCDCGNQSVVSTTELLSNKTQQCWECAHYATNLHKRKDYTGKRFGKLVVTKMIYPDREHKNNETKVVCQCDCGKIITRGIEGLVHNLKSGYISSCGCRRKELAQEATIDVIGRKYGRLTGIKYIQNTKPVKVFCKCDCGNTTTVAKSDLMSGHTQSCGCLQREITGKVNEVDYTNRLTETGIMFLSKIKQTKTGQWIWKGKCLLCGNYTQGIPSKLIAAKTVGCGRHNISSGEYIIESYLKENNIKYISEYRFDECRDQYTLPFDFAIMSDNESIRYLIEYDGQQHYKSVNHFGGEEAFEIRQRHDKIKNEYCKRNNIPLLRLPYYLSNEEIKEKLLSII